MSRPALTPAVIDALKASERLAYGTGTLGEALTAWKPWNGAKVRDLRFAHGMLVVECMSHCNAMALVTSMAWPPARKKLERAELCATLKALLVLVLQGGERAPPNASAQVIDLKSRAAGERDG